MSQGAIPMTAGGGGAAVRGKINGGLQRLQTKGSGTSAPSDIATYEEFVDTDTPGGGKSNWHIYDGTQLVKLGEIDTTNHAVTLHDGVLRLPKGFVSGYTYANNGSDATNDLDIAAGYCVDGTGARLIIGGALTKQTDAAWAVGTNAGMLDTGAIGNNDYYIWAILRSDTGVVDYLCSLSASAPTMPASYDYKRLIGWFKRSGGAIVAFKTYELPGGGLKFMWDAPTVDVSVASGLTTSRRTDAVKVPQNFSTDAIVIATTFDGSATYSTSIMSPDQADAAIGNTNRKIAANVVGGAESVELKIRTNTSGQISARADLATVDLYEVSTQGFEWARR